MERKQVQSEHSGADDRDARAIELTESDDERRQHREEHAEIRNQAQHAAERADDEKVREPD